MKKRPFIGIFMAFLILGCLLSLQEQSSALEEIKAEGYIEGVVFDIVEKADTTQMHLRNCTFYEEAEKKSYPVGTILIYYSKKSDIISIGNQVKVTGSLEHFQTPRNPGQFNEWFYYRSRQYQYKFFGEEIEILEPRVWIMREFLRDLRQRLALVYENNLALEEAGVMKAMVLGEKSGLSEDIKSLYQQNGIGHLMAISGLHVSLLGMGFYKLLERLGSPKKLSCIVAICFIWLYGLMTGFSVSTNRAVVMLMLSLAAGIVGRTYDMATALAISGSLILMQQPMLCLDCGFLLSFGAIVGIGLLNPMLVKVFGLEEDEKSKKEKKEKSQKGKSNLRLMTESIWDLVANVTGKTVIRSLVASLSVQIMTLPIILYFYYEVPFYSVVLNIIVLPLMSILLSVGIIGGMAGVIFHGIPVASRFFLGSAHVILNFYEKCGELFRELPYSRVITGQPAIWQIVIYYVLLGLLVCIFHWAESEEYIGIGKIFIFGKKSGIRKGRKQGFSRSLKGSLQKSLWESLWENLWLNWKKASVWWKRSICVILFFVLVVVLIPTEKWIQTGLEMTFLDVGQGDCIFLKNGTGMTCLIDGGSTDEKKVGTYRIIPFLKAKGIRKLDYVMVTHADGDHMNGILELLEDSSKGGIRVENLVLPKTTLIEENYEKLVTLAAENKIPVLYIKTGDRLVDRGLEITCLHPATDFEPEDVNSYSMVLEVEYGKFKVLLTGDLGMKEEVMLLGNGNLEDVFLLKVAHHGSKNSSCEEFLEKVNPELAVISCGEDNSYGHPHVETLERLESVGSKVMSTAEYGAITVRIGEGGVKAYGYAR